MTSISRRRFIGATAGTLGAASVVTTLPAALHKAVAEAETNAKPGELSQIEHVIVLMQENRRSTRTSAPIAACAGSATRTRSPCRTGSRCGTSRTRSTRTVMCCPFHMDTMATSAAAVDDLSHAWAVQHASWNGGPVIDNSETPPYTWTTYPERLQAAGISWKNYQEPDTGDDNPLAWFAQYQKAPPSSPLYRYGMATALVISPFSTGGRIYREVADYTSTIRFMERLFGVEEPNISAWRRKTCSDFTGALNLRPDRRGSFPGLPPARDYLLRQYITSQDQSPPTVPAVQSLPTQEH